MEEIDETNWKYAHIFFQCVTVASRPLCVDELAQFLSFDFEAESIPTYLADWRPEDPARTVLSMCSSLLAVVDTINGRYVQFAHFSVQEYLMSMRLAKAKDTISRFHVSAIPAHTIVAQTCLGLLLHLDETVTKDSLENFPLAFYAAQYWVAHALIEDVPSKVQDGMNRLFDPGKCHFSVWIWIYDPECDGYYGYLPERSESPGKARATPLHYAAFCGLRDVAKFLIVEHSQDVNARSFDRKDTPLHVASRRGHADIAKLLLEHGADGNAEDIHNGTPLHVSSACGHMEVARILLEHGADAETRDNLNINPLIYAITRKHVEIARLLLKHGADTNTKDINGGQTSLHFASFIGHVGCARVLLEHGADSNSRDRHHETPLHVATRDIYNLEERLDVIRLLVQYGSDIHARDNKDQTPFMTATEYKNDDIMQLLLELGAEDHRK